MRRHVSALAHDGPRPRRLGLRSAVAHCSERPSMTSWPRSSARKPVTAAASCSLPDAALTMSTRSSASPRWLASPSSFSASKGAALTTPTTTRGFPCPSTGRPDTGPNPSVHLTSTVSLPTYARSAGAMTDRRRPNDGSWTTNGSRPPGPALIPLRANEPTRPRPPGAPFDRNEPTRPRPPGRALIAVTS
jgi:hypothetical protein